MTPPNKPVLDEPSPSPSREEQTEKILFKCIVAVGVRENGTVRDLDTLLIDREKATQSINQLITTQISATLDLVEGALPEVKDLKSGFPTENTYATGFNQARQQALEAIKKIRKGLK